MEHKRKKYPICKFKWWYCVIHGIATIIDGLTMIFTLGYFATGLGLKVAMYAATKNIYRK